MCESGLLPAKHTYEPYHVRKPCSTAETLVAFDLYSRAEFEYDLTWEGTDPRHTPNTKKQA